MKGYIVIKTWNKKPWEISEPYNKLKDAVEYAYLSKDECWDYENRIKYDWYIMSLSTGRKKKLMGWKTKYSKKLDEKLDRIMDEKGIDKFSDDGEKEADKIAKEIGHEDSGTHWVEPKSV